MRFIELTTPAAVADAVVDRIGALTAARPAAVLGLATGRTMSPVYAALRRACAEGRVHLGGARSFNLDEFVGVPPSAPASFAATMERELAGVGLAGARRRVPSASIADARGIAAEYEAEIASAGGVDLQLLGLGANGHIGFNEPGSARTTRTRVVALEQSTRAQHAHAFGGIERTPTHALTMGIATILEARRIALIVIGRHKAPVLRRLRTEPESAELPASWLQEHDDTDVLFDADAGSA